MKHKILFLSLLLILTGCSANSDVDTKPKGREFKAQVKIGVKNLPTLTEGHYEGWLLADGKSKSVGKFNINESGAIVDLEGKTVDGGRFNVEYVAAQEASRFLVTIEKEGDNDELRSTTVILEGTVTPLEQGELFFAAYDTESMTGAYELRTFSSENNDETSRNGLWFVTLDGTRRKPLLDVPELKLGWIYEAWIKRGDAEISLGKFSSNRSSDITNSFAKDLSILPAYPGEDFLQGKDEHSGVEMPFIVNAEPSQVFITLEPYSDEGKDLSGPGPFSFRLMESQIGPQTRVKEPYDLINVALNHIPSGNMVYIPGE